MLDLVLVPNKFHYMSNLEMRIAITCSSTP
jgi:hypothetical protein